jgi:alpha-galactosidase
MAMVGVLCGCGPRTLTAILPAPVESESHPEAGPISVGKPDAAVVVGNDCSGPEPTGALAERPPMGWNGWNHLKCDTAYNEAEVMAVADAMVKSGMSAAGYQYVNIDDCWATGRGLDGIVQADPIRYPHGIQYVASYVHDRGLKLGIWSSSGSCGHVPNSQGYEAVDATTFASWGVDYLKFANCDADAEQKAEYGRIRDALISSGRPIVLSISAEHFAHWMPAVGHLWRILRSIEPTWDSITANIATDAPLAPWARAGGWNDPDMLEVGNAGLTDNESRAHLAVWAAMSAPLLAGNDITTMTPSTAALLTNSELIAIDQDSLGLQAARIRNETNIDVFAKPLSTCGARAVVVLNRGDTPSNVHLDWSEIWLGQGTATMRDLLQHADRPASADGTTLTVGARDAIALEIVGDEVPRPKGDAYLSDLAWTYVANGWGPAERDMSNGEKLAGDGVPISLRGTTYAKGLGVHPPSLVRFRLGKVCTRFSADIGIDDEVKGNGSAEFEVWADGKMLYDSGPAPLTGSSPVKRVDIDVTGKSELRLFVNPAQDDINLDHSDWADAMVHCARD